MIQIKDKEIFWKLESNLKIAKKKYGEENIFGIFKLDETIDEVVFIPTFEQLCLNTEAIEEKISDTLKAIDIRLIYNATAHGYPEIINSLYTEYIIINPKYEHLFYKNLKDNREKIMRGIESGNPAQELIVGIIKVMRMAMNENSNAVKFIKKLTDAEKTALEHLVNEIGDEGNFSQSKVAERAGVSRLTMTNLMQKMKYYGVAKVERMGSLGTYYKIIDDTLLNIRGD